MSGMCRALISSAEWSASLDSIDSFALQFCDDIDGTRLELEWVTDATLVQRFKDGVQDTQGGMNGDVNTEEEQEAYVRLGDDTAMLFQLVNVEAGFEGAVLFSDALFSVSSDMVGTIEDAYGLSEYNSNKEKKKQTKCYKKFVEVPPVKKEAPKDKKPEDYDQVELVIYQDKVGQGHNKKYAEKTGKRQRS